MTDTTSKENGHLPDADAFLTQADAAAVLARVAAALAGIGCAPEPRRRRGEAAVIEARTVNPFEARLLNADVEAEATVESNRLGTSCNAFRGRRAADPRVAARSPNHFRQSSLARTIQAGHMLADEISGYGQRRSEAPRDLSFGPVPAPSRALPGRGGGRRCCRGSLVTHLDLVAGPWRNTRAYVYVTDRDSAGWPQPPGPGSKGLLARCGSRQARPRRNTACPRRFPPANQWSRAKRPRAWGRIHD